MKTKLYDKSQSSGFLGGQGPQEFGARDGGRGAVTYLATDLIIQTSTIPGRVIYIYIHAVCRYTFSSLQTQRSPHTLFLSTQDVQQNTRPFFKKSVFRFRFFYVKWII